MRQNSILQFIHPAIKDKTREELAKIKCSLKDGDLRNAKKLLSKLIILLKHYQV